VKVKDSIYLVQNTYGLLTYDDLFLIKARSKKEAIDSVYDIYGREEFLKKHFKATLVKNLFDKDVDKEIVDLSDYR